MWNKPDNISISSPLILMTSPLLKDTFYSIPFLILTYLTAPEPGGSYCGLKSFLSIL